jgi:hypothetical protein
VYDDAQVNVLEEALPPQMNNTSKRIKTDRKNPKHRSFNYEDSTRLAQTLSKIFAFCRVRGHIITKCSQIDNEAKDGFVKHVGQQMLDSDFVEQPQMRKQVQISGSRILNAHSSIRDSIQCGIWYLPQFPCCLTCCQGVRVGSHAFCLPII